MSDTEKSADVRGVAVDRLVSQPCGICSRPGQLVSQFPVPASKSSGIESPWVFRYYMCRWHRAAENRRKRDGEKRFTVLQPLPDETVLAELAG